MTKKHDLRAADSAQTPPEQTGPTFHTSEEKYRNLIEATGTGFVIMDEQGNVTDANAEYIRLSGYETLDEIRGRSVVEWTAAYEQEKNAAAVARCFADGFIHNLEIDYVDREGHITPVEVDATVVQTEAGIQILSLVHDITERKQSEMRYQELMTRLRDGFARVDMTGAILDVNTAFEHIVGYTKEELLQMNFAVFTPEKWRALEAKILAEEVLPRGYALYEKEYLHRDGHIFPVELTVYLFRDDQGNPAGFWGFVRDITERKQDERALREREQQLQAIATNVPGVAYQFYATAQGEMGMLYVSEKAQNIFGLAPDLTTFFPEFAAHVHEADREAFLTSIQKAVATESKWDFQGRFVKSSGETLWFNGMSLPSRRGDWLVFNGILLDITERKQAETALADNTTRLGNILNALPLGMHLYRLEPDGQLVFTGANAAADRLLGVDNRIFVGKTIEEAFPPLVETEVPTRYREAAGAGTPWQTQQIAYDQGEIQGAFEVYAFQTSPGEMAAGFLDVTERIRGEAERARYTTRLSTAADIAGQVAAILDPDELLRAVIPLIKDRFGLYYVHVYTLNEESGILNLRAGYGEPGQIMLERGHNIPLNREASLVATAARTRKPVLVNDVTQNPNFMPNPLLPDTRSEVAVPALAGGKVLGVFDVQHDQPGYFTQADLDVFLTLTGQIATALQNAELFQQQQQSEARFRSIIEVSNTGAWEYHGNVNYLWCSPKYFIMLGRDPEQYVMDGSANLQETWIDLLHPEDREKGSQAFADYLAGGSVGMYENFFRMQHQDGHWVWIWSRGQTLRNPDGSLTDVTLGTHIDITAQRLSEEQLRANEERLSLALESGHVGIWEFWPQKNEVYFNPTWYTMLGYEPYELPQTLSTWGELLHPEDAPHANGIVMQSVQTGTDFHLQFRMKTKDGGWRWIQAHGYVTNRTPEGSTERTIGTHTDITEQKLAEESLQLTRASVEHALDAFYWFNAEGQFMDCNERAVQFLGYSRAELLELTIFDIDPFFLRENWPAFKTQIQQQGTMALDGINCTKAGKFIPVEVMCSYLPFGEQEVYFSINRDITERKAAEDAIRESQQKFQLVADFTYDWEYWLGVEDEFVYISPACERITGYSVEEFMQTPHLLEQIVHPEDRQVLMQHLHTYHDHPEELATAQNAGEAEFRITTKGGEVRWMAHVCQPVYSADGEWLGRRASNRDVTEAKQVEAALETERQQLLAMFDSIDEVIYISDPETYELLYVNEAFRRIWGKNVVGQQCYQVLQGFDSPCPFCTNARIFGEHEGSPYIWEFQNTLSNEWFRCIDKAIRWSDGRMVRYEMAINITASKQIELERERFTTQLGTAAEIAEQVGTILDPDTLLQTVIPLIKERFGLYYVHVYTLDEESGLLNLRAGYGEPGRIMLEQGHSIPLTREASLVATAARTGKPVLVNDVTQTPNFMPNPLLPDTKSEVAVPALAGGKVLGVFDVQHDVTNYFTQADLDVFQTLATQIANVLQNAQIVERLSVTQASIDQAPDAFFWFDAEARFTDVSVTTCQVLGYTRAELLTMRVFDVDPDFPEAAWEGLKAQIKAQGAISLPTRHKAKSGRIFPVQVTVSRTEFGGREIYFSTAKDITEQKRIEAEREQFAAHLRVAAEITTEISAILNADQLFETLVQLTKERFNFYHTQFYDLDAVQQRLILRTGYGQAGQIMKQRHYSIPLEGGRGLAARAARTQTIVVAHDLTQEAEYAPNMLLLDARAEVALPLMQGEHVLGVLDVMADQTGYFTPTMVDVLRTVLGQVVTTLQNVRYFAQQQAAENALRRSSEQIRAMFDAMGDGVIVSNITGEITDTNEASFGLLGYADREDLLHHNILELITPTDRSQTSVGWVTALESGSSGVQKVTFQRKDGSTFAGELTAALLQDADGNPVGFVNITRQTAAQS